MEVTKLLEDLKLTDIKATDKDGNTAFHLTVEIETFSQKKMIEVFKILLDRGVNPDIKNHSHETVLELAVAKRMKDVIDFLTSRNISKDSVADFWVKDEYTKFQCLLTQQSNLNKLDSEVMEVETKSASFVEWLISKGFNFYCENKNRKSALYSAISYNLQHILPILLKHSDKISFLNEKNATLLYLFLENSTMPVGFHGYRHDEMMAMKTWYSERYAVDIVQTLLDRGVSADAEDKYNVTPIEIAIKRQAPIGVIKILLGRCAKIHHKIMNNETILQMAVTSSLSNTCETGYYLEILPFIVAEGADIKELNTPDRVGQIAVCKAVNKRNMDVIDFLRDNGADFGVTTEDGKTLLHLLAESSHLKIDEGSEMKLFNLLIDKGCQVNAEDEKGNTPLHVAVTDGNMAIIRKLIEHGADVNCRTPDGVTPLYIAVEKFNLALAQLLRANGADFSVATKNGDTLMHLCTKESSRIFNMFLHQPETIDGVFDLLINESCEINAKDETGESPLHLAVMKAEIAFVEKLIKHGADVDSRNNQKKTPLYFAVRRDNTELARVLLEHGANVNARNSKGRTALHKIAVWDRFIPTYVLPILLEYGADVNVQDLKKLTALSCARSRDAQDFRKKCEVYVVSYNNKISLFDEDEHDWDSEDEPSEQMTIADCPLKETISDVVKLLTQQSIKLKAASLPWDKQVDSWLEDSSTSNEYGDHCKQYYEKCMEELETLKSTIIENRISLYTLLHMDLNTRCVYRNNEKLKKLVGCPKLANRFPKYADVILASYREAVMRKSLLEPAKEAWLELTEIALPEPCVECIISFLSNSDLFDMIERD